MLQGKSLAWAIIRMLGNIVLFLAVFKIVQIAHRELVFNNWMDYRHYLQANIPVFVTIVFSLTFLALLLVFQVRKLALKDRHVGLLARCGFSPVERRHRLLLTLMGAAGAIFFISLMKLSFIESGTDHFEIYVSQFGKAYYFIYVLVGIGFLGVLFEEILFRGLVMNELRGTVRSVPLLVLLQALVYGYFQPNLSIQMTAFFLGIMYGIVYVKLRTLWSTVWIGTVVNVLIFSASWSGLIDWAGGLPDAALLASAALSIQFIIGALIQLWKPEQQSFGAALRGALANRYVVLAFKLAIYVAVYYGLLRVLVLIYRPFTDNGAFGEWLLQNSIIGLIANAVLAPFVYAAILRFGFRTSLLAAANFSRIGARPLGLSALLAVGMGVWVMCLFHIPAVKASAGAFHSLIGFFMEQGVLMFTIFIVVNSFYKEILFRALVFNDARKALPFGVALVLTGIVYGQLFFQLDPILTGYGTAGAIIFGLLYHWYKSLWITIVNEFVLFVTYYVLTNAIGVPQGIPAYVLLVLSSVVVLGAMYRLWKGSRGAEAADRLAPAAGSPMTR